MPTYCITPCGGSPVVWQAGNIEKATARARFEFSAGLLSVAPVTLPKLAAMAAEGTPLPVAIRNRLKVYLAVQREKAKADARVEAVREQAREKVQAQIEEDRAKLRAQRAEDAAQRAALKAQEKATQDAERKRKALAERRALLKAERLKAVPEPAALTLCTTDDRLPWDD